MSLASIIARNVRPCFKHDCKHCVFLGSLDGQDLYVCTAHGGTTYQRRMSSRPDHYGSVDAPSVPLLAKGSPYALAAALDAIRHSRGKGFRANAYRTVVEDTDAEPDSGQLEREYEDRILAQAEARIGTF